MRLLLIVALAACGACGGDMPHAASPAPVPHARGPGAIVPSGPVATTTREARGAELSLRGYLFDPALDCVASRLDGRPDPARYRNALPIECGSPLHPVDARLIAPADLQVTLDAMAKRFVEPVPIAIGTAPVGDKLLVVMAAHGVELEPYSPGDATIRGKLLVKVTTLKALVSSNTGVAMQDVTRDGDRFSLPAPRGDADIEFSIVNGTETGPLARIRVGRGSALFAGEGSLVERTNAARSSVHLPAVTGMTSIGECTTIPSKLGDVDVTDRASCFRSVKLTAAELVDELHYGPVLQLKLLQPDIALVEVGDLDGDAAYRALRRFEVLTPEQGRARVLARLREKWPKVAEHRAPGLSALLDAWAASGQPDETNAQFKPKIVELGAHWSRSPHFAYALSTSRDLEKAIALALPGDSPAEVDIEFRQVRDNRGEMRNLIALVAATP